MACSQEKEENIGKLIYKRGIPFSTVFSERNIEEIFDFEPNDGDVIIAAFPKTGTTWIQYIVLQILTNGECFPSFSDLKIEVAPFLELTGVSAVKAMTRKPRVYKHHMPYNVVKKNPNSKVICMYRKPEDTMVSYYFFWKQFYGSYDFDKFFEDFLNGNVPYGRYLEHVLSYLKHRSDGNILFVSYEKLKFQTEEEVLRVARFLGEEYHSALLKDKSLLGKIVEHTSFDYMKKHLVFTAPQQLEKWKDHKYVYDKEYASGPRKEVHYFRKGIVGDGENMLTVNQLQKVRELAEKLMGRTDIFAEWYNS